MRTRTQGGPPGVAPFAGRVRLVWPRARVPRHFTPKRLVVPLDALPVRHLFTITANTAGNTMLQGAPQGNRLLVTVTGGSFEGPELRGTVESGGGDWVTMRADGSLKLDVRITLRTHDGAAILMTYNGIGVNPGSGYSLRTAPLFETGDARYAWLNNVQAVAHGAPGHGNVKYDVYALT